MLSLRLYPSRSCRTPLSPGARTLAVPSPRPASARSLVAALATAANRTGQRHRWNCRWHSVCCSPSSSLFLSLLEEFAHSAIHAAIRATRSTTNATYALCTSALRPFLAFFRSCSLSSSRFHRVPHTCHTSSSLSNLCATHVARTHRELRVRRICVCVCMYTYTCCRGRAHNAAEAYQLGADGIYNW